MEAFDSHAVLFDIIKSRRSVRCFKENDHIDEQSLYKILEAARHAPSARNLQPIEFVLLNDEAQKAQIAVACRQNQPKIAPISVLVAGNLEIAGKVGEVSSHDTTTKEKGEKMFIFMDAAAAIQNMLLTATSLGIDSLWISSFDETEISKIVNLPESHIPLAVLSFGHRSKSPFAPPKLEIQDRLHHNFFKKRERDLAYLETCRLINEPHGEYNDKKT
jgi:nitroreductase